MRHHLTHRACLIEQHLSDGPTIAPQWLHSPESLLDSKPRVAASRLRAYVPCVQNHGEVKQSRCEVLTEACESLMGLLSSSPARPVVSLEDIKMDRGSHQYTQWFQKANVEFLRRSAQEMQLL